MLRPSLTLIGGPNGSGKTSVLTVLRDLGVGIPNYHNADDLRKTLSGPYDETARRAQEMVRDAREAAIAARHSVTYETVMSHPSHAEAMQRAVDRGFYVRLIFVTTKHPDINVARVARRVAQGGHDVPEDKIRSRYKRCLGEGLARAAMIADESMIWDNSADAPAPPLPVAHVMGQFVRRFPTPGIHWPQDCLFAPLQSAGYVFEG